MARPIAYDLAILGGSFSSRSTAVQASRQGARVALIAPYWHGNNVQEYAFQALRGCCLQHITDWQQVHGRFEALCRQPFLTPAVLRSQGIDVILESARFTQDQCLQLEQRHLKASRYLLTDGYYCSAKPQLKKRLFCHQLMELDVLPTRLRIVGSGASVVEWAYGLSFFTQVTILCNTQQLLPAEDRDIQRLVEAQLKSLGIVIHFVDGSLGPQEPPRDQPPIDLLVEVPQPKVDPDLGLEHLGVEAIHVNRYLQSHCLRLYVTGHILGGEQRSELTQQENSLALDNALFNRYQAVDYTQAAYGIDSVSTVGRWGLTERQARHRYGTRMATYRGSCLPLTTLQAAETNFCKLITVGNCLLGVHLLGQGAAVLAKGMGQCQTMTTMAKWALGHCQPGTWYGAVYGAIAQWQNQRWQPGQWRRDWAENWFNWRRSQGS